MTLFRSSNSTVRSPYSAFWQRQPTSCESHWKKICHSYPPKFPRFSRVFAGPWPDFECGFPCLSKRQHLCSSPRSHGAWPPTAATPWRDQDHQQNQSAEDLPNNERLNIKGGSPPENSSSHIVCSGVRPFPNDLNGSYQHHRNSDQFWGNNKLNQ